MADEKRENRRPRRQEVDDGLIKKTVEVNRVTKVVKGGKNMRFAALVLVGDGKRWRGWRGLLSDMVGAERVERG